MACGSVEPCDCSTDRTVVRGVATGLEAMVTTADVRTVMGFPIVSLGQHAGYWL